jgi:hypothetical protein
MTIIRLARTGRNYTVALLDGTRLIRVASSAVSFADAERESKAKISKMRKGGSLAA